MIYCDGRKPAGQREDLCVKPALFQISQQIIQTQHNKEKVKKR